MFKLKEEFEFKKLENYGFKTFYGLNESDGLIATRNIKIQGSLQYYKIGVYEKDRLFDKSKFRGFGRCLLTVNVKKEDIQDLIDDWIVERVRRK